MHTGVIYLPPSGHILMFTGGLTGAALESTKIIAESLTQFKKAPDALALPGLKDRSVAS